MLILGVESSCDETAAAVLEDGKFVRSNIINSQIAIHSKYGGVVPELASRNHIKNISSVVDEALRVASCSLDDIDYLAVTTGPGLIGSLLIGLSFVKAISYTKKIPYICVDHISGHLLSVFLGAPQPTFPYIALIASGGHTSLFLVQSFKEYTLLGRTRDDAAGEAFDKVSKLLNLGYPGGPVISERASLGDPEAVRFPRAWLGNESFDFSFSGLKTSVATYVRKHEGTLSDSSIHAICASFQEAVVDVLVEKALRAAQQHKVPHIVLGGGVAANAHLRNRLQQRCFDEKFTPFITPLPYCTDNAAMIAYAGFHSLEEATTRLDADVFSRSPLINGQ